MNDVQRPSTEDPAKREAILEQSIRTFAELGFRGTDVQVIADRAGVGKGTVYRYFGSKEDLFWAANLEVLERQGRYVMAKMEGIDDDIERVRMACHAYAAFFEENPHYLEVFVQDRAEFRGAAPETHLALHNALIGHFEHVFEQGVANGVFRDDDVRKTVVSVGSMLYGTVLFNSYAHTDYSLTEATGHAARILLSGILADPSAIEGGGVQ